MAITTYSFGVDVDGAKDWAWISVKGGGIRMSTVGGGVKAFAAPMANPARAERTEVELVGQSKILRNDFRVRLDGVEIPVSKCTLSPANNKLTEVSSADSLMPKFTVTAKAPELLRLERAYDRGDKSWSEMAQARVKGHNPTRVVEIELVDKTGTPSLTINLFACAVSYYEGYSCSAGTAPLNEIIELAPLGNWEYSGPRIWLGKWVKDAFKGGQAATRTVRISYKATVGADSFTVAFSECLPVRYALSTLDKRISARRNLRVQTPVGRGNLLESPGKRLTTRSTGAELACFSFARLGCLVRFSPPG
jgi:hypothetical protein